MLDIPTEIKNKSDAEKCVRIIRRRYLNGTISFVVQMAAVAKCLLCGEVTLEWREFMNFALDVNTREEVKKCKTKAIQTRLNLIGQLVDNTITEEKEVRG